MVEARVSAGHERRVEIKRSLRVPLSSAVYGDQGSAQTPKALDSPAHAQDE